MDWCFCCYPVCKLSQSYHHTAFKQGCTRSHTCKSYNNIYFVPKFLWWAKIIVVHQILTSSIQNLSTFSATFCIVQWSVTNMKLESSINMDVLLAFQLNTTVHIHALLRIHIIRGQRSTLSFGLFIAMVITRNLQSSCLNCCPFHVGNREPLSSLWMLVIFFYLFFPSGNNWWSGAFAPIQTVSCQSKCHLIL